MACTREAVGTITVLAILYGAIASAQAPEIEAGEPPEPQPEPNAIAAVPTPTGHFYGPASLREIMRDTAARHGLPDWQIRQMERVIDCESGWKPWVVGDQGTSYGLVQIHLPAHPWVDEEMALDPVFSLEFMAGEWAAGRQWQWSCWMRFFGGF